MSAGPERPPIPPLAWVAAGVWAGCLIGEELGWQVLGSTGRAPSSLPWAVVLGAVCAGSVVYWRCGRLRTLMVLVCAGLLAGTALSALQGWGWHHQWTAAAECGARSWVGVVEADPLPGAYGAVVRVRLLGGPLHRARVRVGWPEGEPVPDLGRTVRFSAIMKPLPLTEPWARRMARAAVCATGTAWKAQTGLWRSGVLGRLFAWRARALVRMHAVPGAGGNLAEGIVLGDRRRLVGTATEEDFRLLGLTHLVAVSGSHLALACAAVAWLGTMLRLPKRWLVALTVTAGGVYAIVTGMPYSALRSFAMLAVAGVAQSAGRRGDGVASLATAVIVVLVIEPWAAFDLGFQLSALAVLGLLLFGSLASAWFSRGVPGPARPIASTLALTVVAQLLTAPVVTSGFGMISVLAPVANAVAGPLVSVALLFGLSGVVIGSVAPGVGAAGTSVCAAVLGATAWLAQHMAELPGSAVAMTGGAGLVAATTATAVAVWIRWPLPRAPRAGMRAIAGALCVSVALALGPAPLRSTSVVVLDVGQGDAILVRDAGRSMLVDTGAEPGVLRAALARTALRRVDVLVLTHAHGDHTGGAAGLSGLVDVGWIAIPTRAESEAGPSSRDPMPGSTSWRGPDAEVRAVSAGDSWRIGTTQVNVLWPPAKPSGDVGTNDTSVVLQLITGDFDMVLTGDAEGAAQSGMAAAGTMAEVEVLKVPHHGSSNGLTAEGLAAWSPRHAVISVGTGNDFGHPSASTLDLLEAAGVTTLRTDEAGDVTVLVNHSGYVVRTARRGSTPTVRARMHHARDASPPAGPHQSVSVRGARGQDDDRCVETRVPDLRRRGSAPRARPPPPEEPHRRGR